MQQKQRKKQEPFSISQATKAASLALVKSYNVAPHPALERYHNTQAPFLQKRQKLLVRHRLNKETGQTEPVWRENVTVYCDESGEVLFYFDEVEAERWVRFIQEHCRHVKGRWSGQTLKLHPWQLWLIREFYGWRQIGTALRRYKYLFLYLPRKNGKSLLVATLALGHLLLDPELGPEIYATASTDEQAGKLFEMARGIIKQDLELTRKLEALKGNISYRDGREGYFRPIPFNPDGFHGANPSVVILDEYHVHKTTGMKRVGETGVGAREQPAVIIISTAGDRRNTPCELELNYAKAIRDGALAVPNYLPAIFQADENKPWDDLQTAIECNPCYPETPSKAFLLDEIEKARRDPAIMLEYQQLQLNWFIEKRTIWLDWDVWIKCRSRFDFREFRGQSVYWGVDLGSTDDLTALVLCKPGGLYEGDWHYYCHFWCPGETVKRKALLYPYAVWEKQGYLVRTPGAGTDHGFLRKDIETFDKMFALKKGRWDRANATSQATEMINTLGLNIEYMGQGSLSMTEPIKFLKTLALNGRLKVFNPVLDWMSANCVTVGDSRAIKFDKADNNSKIDGMVAMAMATSAALSEIANSEEEKQGGIFFV